jgi:cell division protein FtsB
MRTFRAFSILILFLALAAIHLAIYTSSIKTGYDINDLKKKLNVVHTENRYLNYLVAKEEALPKIEQASKNKLKMSYPKDMNYIIVGTGEAN